MPHAPKRRIYEQFARVGKAVSAPKRLELLDLLCQGPRTVEVLADLVALTHRAPGSEAVAVGGQ